MSRALLALVRMDLERRLGAGEAIRVEKCLAQHPKLSDDRQAVVTLARAEFVPLATLAVPIRTFL